MNVTKLYQFAQISSSKTQSGVVKTQSIKNLVVSKCMVLHGTMGSSIAFPEGHTNRIRSRTIINDHDDRTGLQDPDGFKTVVIVASSHLIRLGRQLCWLDDGIPYTEAWVTSKCLINIQLYSTK